MTALERPRVNVLGQLPAFACGFAALVLAYVLLPAVHAQGDRVVVACADAEGRLRVPEGACPPGETLVPLKPVELPREEKPQQDPAVGDLDRRLRDLEASLKGDAKMLDGTVEAPFEVFNEARVKIFSVEEESLDGRAIKVFNNAGKHVAWIYGTDQGYMRTMSATSDLRTEINADRLTVVNHEYNRYRLELGRNQADRHSLRLYNQKGKVVAGIGQSEAEHGLVVIADEEGNVRHRVRMSDGAGHIELVNTEGIGVATLGVDARQNGLLQLFNGEGTKMVEAGTLDTGIGLVKAGPGAFQPGFGPLGLPGSYIQGKQQ